MAEQIGVHSFSSNGRKGINISGVREVLSFDDSGVSLETECGSMAVEGEDLHVTVLNITEGKVAIEGKINGVYYFDRNSDKKRGFFSKK